MKISTIHIHNYRAFYPKFDQRDQPEPYEITTDDKNVLIYGENGAGKTSLFRAFQDFFHSSQQGVRLVKNYFVPQPAPGSIQNLDGQVDITFSDGSQYSFTDSIASTTTTQLFLQRSQMASGFLTYVELIKTYLPEGQSNQSPELFDLLVNTILREHLLPPSTSQTVGAEWKQLTDDVNAHRRSLTLKARLNHDGTVNCTTFNVGLTNLLNQIEAIVNKWLGSYFQHGTEISFSFSQVEQGWDTNRRRKVRELRRSLQISPKLHNQSIGQDSLNEARLSALAICIFLASIRTYPRDINRLNVLYLDDVFIGLDMSNRLPLLDILRNEFSDYQIFLSTYDRAWFEIAKRVVSDWQTVEMYSTEQGRKGEPGYCERPVIITPSDDHYSRARKYYQTKDYSASANYLRKELEQQIKNRVAEEDIRAYDSKPRMLQWLWERMLSRYEAYGKPINEDVKTTFDRCKLTIFNPMSHDALSLPVYRTELDKAFWVTEEIKKLEVIRRVCLLRKGMILTYKNEDNDYWVDLELQKDWYIEVHNGACASVPPTCKAIKGEYKGKPFPPAKNDEPFEKSLQSITGYLGLPAEEDLKRQIEVEGHNLSELLKDTFDAFSRPTLNFLMR